MAKNMIEPSPGAKLLMILTNDDVGSIESRVYNNETTATATERNETIAAVLLLIFK